MDRVTRFPEPVPCTGRRAHAPRSTSGLCGPPLLKPPVTRGDGETDQEPF